jgi:mannosyltransferase
MDEFLPRKGGNVKKNQIFALLFLLLLGFALRFYSFDRKSFWIDEVHTFNESRDGLMAQIQYYKGDPSSLHPPLFFILTHFFYPFSKPERDLRIIPLIFGVLSIPLLFFLSRLFSRSIALPCTLSLALMTYHISLSQDGRSYSLLMFLGMAGLYSFVKHLMTAKKAYLFSGAFFFAILFYTSYSSILFIAFCQLLWFYRINEDKRPRFSSFVLFNCLILLQCLPWILFIALHYSGQSFREPLHTEVLGTFFSVFYGVLHDWVPNAPLTIVASALWILFPVLSRDRRGASLLLAAVFLAVGGTYLFCHVLHYKHFVTSRYFIEFFPLFLISLYLSLEAIERRFHGVSRFFRLKILFAFLFIASNLVTLPLYYRSEKQDFRGLVTYLKGQLQPKDKIIVGTSGYFPGLLHYFGIYPEGRHYQIYPVQRPKGDIEYQAPFSYDSRKATISYSKTYWFEYLKDGSRLWIVATKPVAKELRKYQGFFLKGFFDGSFFVFPRFPTDASIYLFLWDPRSIGESEIDLPIE